MATIKAFNSIKVAGKQHLSVGSHMSPLYHEAAAQSFKAGAPVKLIAGLVTTIVTPAAGSDAEIIAGIALQDGQNVATKPATSVSPAAPGIVYEAVLGNSGDDLYALTAADGDVGKAAPLLLDGANLGWYVNATLMNTDASGVANARVRIVGYKDAAGTVNGRVYFVFLVQGTNNAGNAAVARATIYS
jgi:hypothetical protein